MFTKTFVCLCNGLELDVNMPYAERLRGYWRLSYLLKPSSIDTQKFLIVGTFCIIKIKLVLRESFSLFFGF